MIITLSGILLTNNNIIYNHITNKTRTITEQKGLLQKNLQYVRLRLPLLDVVISNIFK
jgi:hypothetical protein